MLTTNLTGTKITAGGTGYTDGTYSAVTFTGGGGSGAVGTATVVGGIVTKVLINAGFGGSGYTSAPTIDFTSLGAHTTAATGVGDFDLAGLNISNRGSGYTSAPTITVSSGNGAFNAIIGGVVSITVTNAGTGYTSAPDVVISGGNPTPTTTIKSSALASINSGRIDPTNSSQLADLATVTSNGGISVFATNISDSFGHYGASNNFSLLGIQIAPSTGTKTFTGALLGIGENSGQNTAALAPHNFVVDRCYIHGYDDITGILGATANANRGTSYANGIGLSAQYVTISNSYISDMHNLGQDNQAIGGSNGLGNYNITNNFLEATGENIMFGGGVEWIPNGTATNITITHNYFFKRLAWDQFDINYVPFYNTSGKAITEDVKNLLELKNAINVTVDSNLFENCWVGADQFGTGIVLSPKNTHGAGGDYPWTVVANVSVTNNVIRNVGQGMGISLNDTTTQGHYNSVPMHDVFISNNLFENVHGAQAGEGTGVVFSVHVGPNLPPGWNITIDHNTAFDADHMMNIDASGSAVAMVVATNFIYTNNVGLYGQNLNGQLSQLNNATNAFNFSNHGSGYTAAPTVSLSSGGGSGATATAHIANGCIVGLTITSGGSGFTSAPTILFSNDEGIDAVGVGIITGGQLTGIQMLDVGSGYTDANVDVYGGGGSGVVATANIANGVVDYITMTNNGSGYTSAPTVSFSGGGGTGVAATALIADGRVAGWRDTNNVLIGTPSSQTAGFPTGNWYDTQDEDDAGFVDTAGENFGFLSTSIYHTTRRATDSTDPGVSMSAITTAMNSYGVTNDFVAVDSALQGYWKLDEGTGTTSTDVTGNGHTATINGTSSAWAGAGNGEVNNGVTLAGGSTGNISASLTTTSSFSYVAFIKPASVSATQYIGSTGNNAFSLWIDATGHLNAKGKTGSTITDGAVLTTGNWYLVGVTFDGTNIRLYKNGVQVGSATAATTAAGATTLYMGGNVGSVSTFNGTIDEVRYYTASLTAPQSPISTSSNMLALYNGFAPIMNGISPTLASKQTTTTTVLSAFALSHSDTLESATGHNGALTTTYTWSLNQFYDENGVAQAGNATFDAAVNGTYNAHDITATWNSGSGFYEVKVVVTDLSGHGTTTYALHKIHVTINTTPPIAPSNLAASPGLSSIALTWSDNSTDETSFDLQRSDDLGATWNSIAAPAANATTYTDTTVAADGTAYLYQVAAVSSGGTSTYAALPNGCAVATLIASDSFNYTAGAWTGGNTGLGFAGNWVISNTSKANVTAGSLTYSNNSHTLITSNNKVNLTGGATATQTLSTTVGTAGTTLWIGAEISTTSTAGEIDIGPSSTDKVSFGIISNNFQATAKAGGGSYTANCNLAATANTTYFVVCEIQYLTAGDVVTIYVNPQPGTDGAVNALVSATRVLPASSQLSATTKILLSGLGTGPIDTFDELRLGYSYAAVAPDPIVEGISATAAVNRSTGQSLRQSDAATPRTLAAHSLVTAAFASVLSASPLASADLDMSWHNAPADYHLQPTDGQDDADALTLDSDLELTLQR